MKAGERINDTDCLFSVVYGNDSGDEREDCFATLTGAYGFFHDCADRGIFATMRVIGHDDVITNEGLYHDPEIIPGVTDAHGHLLIDAKSGLPAFGFEKKRVLS